MKDMRGEKRKMKKTLKFVIPMAIATVMLTGCVEDDEMSRQQQAKVANAKHLMGETKTPNITKSLERENIRQRILVSNDPNTLQWIYPMSAGRVIGRFPVKGKVTSGNKRLTTSQAYSSGTGTLVEAPDEMGTYGSSETYVFWFDPAGLIHQHRGDYFVSPVPYKIEEGYGTISTQVDESEQQNTTQYKKQMEVANKQMEELSKNNEKVQVSNPKEQGENQ
ncbi:hypothetical protein CN357_21425 [Bacillus cereus]|uniref:Lipoprotein n=5 Tax=Bacillus cereus group TaxID=86661 RepID=A0A9X6ZE40_BACCE|nr:hypothetical protein bthur0002_58840 [Bacillus thuringiensis Bt407]PES55150.1 hypothetical protein CN515_03570 [Bacillus cereus]PFA29551.1 hypothetical protein CN384_07595 [Bacillus thuringiensis]PGB17869.1 hypothetical protein COM09_03530 [Bacillus toyonensis]PQZ77940.1 hypothetical protein CQ064_08805 [Bacillus sp. MYb78]